MSFEAFSAQLDRNIARGSLNDNIPPEIEEAAIQLLEQESEAVCGVRWVWHDQPDELRNRYRLWAFTNARRETSPIGEPMDPRFRPTHQASELFHAVLASDWIDDIEESKGGYRVALQFDSREKVVAFRNAVLEIFNRSD